MTYDAGNLSHPVTTEEIEEFILRWEQSSASERANSQTFLNELCDILRVSRPDVTQADDNRNHYVFEKRVTFVEPGEPDKHGWVDLYKEGCFVLESKQGSEKKQPRAEQLYLVQQSKLKSGTATRGTTAWQAAMNRARVQAEAYA